MSKFTLTMWLSATRQFLAARSRWIKFLASRYSIPAATYHNAQIRHFSSTVYALALVFNISIPPI